MHVTAILFGSNAAVLPPASGGRAHLEVAEGSTVQDVLDALAVPLEGRSFLTLDGERVQAQTPVRDGSVLRVIVPLGGG